MNDDLGALPGGKLGDDRLTVTLAIAGADSTLLVHFGKPVGWIGMDYEGAICFADNIREKAEEMKAAGEKAAADALYLERTSALLDAVMSGQELGWQQLEALCGGDSDLVYRAVHELVANGKIENVAPAGQTSRWRWKGAGDAHD